MLLYNRAFQNKESVSLMYSAMLLKTSACELFKQMKKIQWQKISNNFSYCVWIAETPYSFSSSHYQKKSSLLKKKFPTSS